MSVLFSPSPAPAGRIVVARRFNGGKGLAVAGMRDHAHVLLSLPTTIAVAKAVQLIKGGSSKWINDHLNGRSFEWQDGYGAFTIGISQLQTTIRYIDNQERHHSRMSFDQELRRMLERHGLQLYQPWPSSHPSLAGTRISIGFVFPPLKRRATTIRPAFAGLGSLPLH
jgi:transposase IS200 family protein